MLGQLLRDAQSSFFFSPCLDLFQLLSKEPRQYERLTDLDIVCIKDGKFVIGEVKNSQARFELESCLALAKIAKAVQADVLLFSSLEDHQTRQTEEMISKVRDELIGSNVDVGWYQLGQEIFEASRMDH